MKYDSTKVEVVPIEGKGLGVIAKQDFKKGDIIEIAPTVELPDEDSAFIGCTSLGSYWFGLGERGSCIGLGYSSLYNYSKKPNAWYVTGSRTVIFKAGKSIKKGEEITVNYGWDKVSLRKLKN